MNHQPQMSDYVDVNTAAQMIVEGAMLPKARKFTTYDFVRESNRIEGIHRDPTQMEVDATDLFINITWDVRISDLVNLVNVYEPGAALRDQIGLDVRVGDHIPPRGGIEIPAMLRAVLEIKDPWTQHVAYENLHPFTDGNGRTGRALWLRNMTRKHGGAPLGFLQSFYYQTLDKSDR